MTIGQALAMMRSAEQFKDYQNRLNAQPTIDWRDVTQQQVGPQAPPVGYASMPMGQAVFAAPPPIPAEEYTQYEAPVGPPDEYAVESPIAGEPYVPMEQASEPLGLAPFDYSAVVSNAQPEPVSPASQFAAYQQRVGAVGPDLFSRDYSEPQTDYSTRPPQQQAAFAALPFTSEVETQGAPKLPPPPIPGARRPESSAMSMFDLRPDKAMTDVSMEEEIPAGTELATLEQPVEGQPGGGKPSKTEPPKPVWTPGQKWSATLKYGENQYPATVTKYTPAEDGGRKYPAKVTLDLGGGRTRTMEVAPEDANYKAIESQYQNLVDKGGKELQYTAKVKIGNDFLPARYDPESRQIKYLDTSLVDPTQKEEFAYAEKPISKLTPEEFIGSIDAEGKPDVKELEKIKRESRMPLSTKIRGSVPGLVRGWRGPDSREDIRDRLVGKLTATDEDPVGTIEWSYNEYDKQGNFRGQITLEEAIKRGIVPARVFDNLTRQWKTALGTYEGYMKSAEAAQGIESPTARDRNVSGIKKNIDDLTEQIKQLDADYADGKITLDQRDNLKKKAQKALDKEQADLIDALSATPGIINTGGGTVGYEAPPSETGSSIIPRSVIGLRALLAGAPAVQPANVAPDEVTPFTDEQIIENLKTRALEDVKTRPMKDDPNFARAMVEWQNRMLDIEDYLGKIADEQDTTVDEILSRPTTFRYYIDPGFGSDVTEIKTMPLDTAIDEFLGSIQNLRTVLGSGDELEIATAREKFEGMAKMFSGGIKIRGVKVDNPEAQNIFNGQYDTEEGLGRDSALLGARNFFDIDKQMNMPVIRSEQFAPTTVERRAPESTVTRTPSGRTTPTPAKTPAYAIFQFSNDPNEKAIRADTGFNIFNVASGSEDAYKAMAARFGAQLAADAASGEYLSRVTMRDDGNVSPETIAAYDKGVEKFNTDIIQDTASASEARKAMAETLANALKLSGLELPRGASGIAAKAESLYRDIKDAEEAGRPLSDAAINAKIWDFIKYATGYNDATGFADLSYNSLKNNGGYQSKAMSEAYARVSGAYKGELKGSNSKFVDNGVNALWEAGLLFANAAKGKTSLSVPSAGAQRTVTWLINPANPIRGVTTSIITAPTSLAAGSGAPSILPYQAVTAAEGSSQAKLPDANAIRSNPAYANADPAVSNLLVKMSALGGAPYTIIKNFGDDAMQPVVGEANKFQGQLGSNLFAVNTRRSGMQQEDVSWQGPSSMATKNYAIGTLMLTNVLGKERARPLVNGSFVPFKTQ